MANRKKEISKEAMFSKIMPTGPLSHTVAPNVKKSKPYDPYEDDREQRAAAVIADQEKALKGETKKEEISPEQAEADKYVEKLEARKKPDSTSEQANEIINEKRENHTAETESKKGEKKSEDKESENEKANKSEKILITNIREKMVEQKVDEAMEKFNCCTCSLCRQDVLCRSLNSLPPKYMAVTEEDVDKIIEKEDFSEVTQAIMKAILHVKTNPKH